MHQGQLVFAQLMRHLPLSTFRRCAYDRLKVVDVPKHEAMKCIKGLGIGSKALLAGRL